MSKQQKLNIVTNAKQKSYGIKEALAQKPESTHSALNVSPAKKTLKKEI